MDKEITLRPRGAVAKLNYVTDEQFDLATDLAKRRMWVEVRRAMKEAELSQADAARLLGVNRSTVSRMLSKPSNLSLERASRIIRAAGAFVTFGREAVSQSAISRAVREETRNNFLEVVSSQPGNRWVLTFEREPGHLRLRQNPESGAVVGLMTQNISPVYVLSNGQKDLLDVD